MSAFNSGLLESPEFVVTVEPADVSETSLMLKKWREDV